MRTSSDRPAFHARGRDVAGQQHLVAARDDPQVDVRRPAFVRHRVRTFEAEATRTVGDHGGAAGSRVHAQPVRLPEVNLGSRDRTAVDREDDARQHMSFPDRGPTWRRASAEWPSPVRHRGRTPLRGRSRGSGTHDDQHERHQSEADCNKPSHTSRCNKCRASRPAVTRLPAWPFASSGPKSSSG